MNSDRNNADYQTLKKQLIQDYMRRSMDELSNKDRNNNSFAFLENSTLDMIIFYIFQQLEQQSNNNNYQMIDADVSASVIDELNEAIDNIKKENKQAYEEIIEMIKAKL